MPNLTEELVHCINFQITDQLLEITATGPLLAKSLFSFDSQVLVTFSPCYVIIKLKQTFPVDFFCVFHLQTWSLSHLYLPKTGPASQNLILSLCLFSVVKKLDYRNHQLPKVVLSVANELPQHLPKPPKPCFTKIIRFFSKMSFQACLLSFPLLQASCQEC